MMFGGVRSGEAGQPAGTQRHDYSATGVDMPHLQVSACKPSHLACVLTAVRRSHSRGCYAGCVAKGCSIAIRAFA